MSWNFSPVPILTPKRLEQQLEELDITNVEAAFFAGVSQATMYRWLANDSPIPASVIRMFDLMIHARHGADMVKIVWGEPADQEAAQ
jgi:hypothetical protein